MPLLRSRLQWVWNLRLELGQRFSPAAMRTTEFAPTCEPEPAPPAPISQPVAASEPAPVLVYGPPHWAQRSFTGGFPGSAFPLQPDGNLLCPAHHPLYPQERRPERDGSSRVVYAARIGDCRSCDLRAQCQESLFTTKPRRVSAVFWPISSKQMVSPAPILGPPEPTACCPVLWGDWPRCQIRRHWLKVVRSETVVVTRGATPTPDQTSVTDEPVITRAQRAHWRLSWDERLARNARPATASPLTIIIHGLPAPFAQA